MTPRRELQLAVLLCLLGSAVVLVAVSQAWLSYSSSGITIKDLDVSVSGARISTSTRSLGLVGLVGVLALAATRRWGRVLVGVLVAGAGAGVVVACLQVVRASPESLVPADVDGQVQGVERATAWPASALLGGVTLVLAGALVTARGRQWAALSSSHEPPVAGRPGAPTADKEVWDALDRGDDPTA